MPIKVMAVCRDVVAQQDSACLFFLRQGYAHFLGRAEPDIHVKNSRRNSGVEQFGGGKRAVFKTTTENDNGIRFGHRFTDHPGLGQTREQRSAKT